MPGRSWSVFAGPMKTLVLTIFFGDLVGSTRLQTERGNLLRGAARAEAACARALAFDDVGYTTIKRILDRGLDRVPIPTAAAAILPTSTATLRFARPASDFFPVEA